MYKIEEKQASPGHSDFALVLLFNEKVPLYLLENCFLLQHCSENNFLYLLSHSRLYGCICFQSQSDCKCKIWFFVLFKQRKSPSEQNLKKEVCLLLTVVLKGFAVFELYRKMLTGKFPVYWL